VRLPKDGTIDRRQLEFDDNREPAKSTGSPDAPLAVVATLLEGAATRWVRADQKLE
jgi:hypothetical protein